MELVQTKAMIGAPYRDHLQKSALHKLTVALLALEVVTGD
jgi:hypothetical protein